MRVRSTGLGDSELVLSISEIKRVGDCLVMEGRSSEPVKWHIRMAASYRDMWQMTWLVLNPKNLFFLLWKTLCLKGSDKICWPDKF